MHRGKYARTEKKGRTHKRHALLLISLILLLTAVIGGTIAYLKDSSGIVKNTFIPAKVNIHINENKTQDTKYNISVTNATVASEDAIPVYIRANLVVYWTDVIEDVERIIPKPEGAGVSVPAPVGGWFLVGDTYYYPDVVKPGESTYAMVLQENPIKVTIPPNTSIKCYIDVQAEAIQAEPETVVGQVWTDVKVVKGRLTAK